MNDDLADALNELARDGVRVQTGDVVVTESGFFGRVAREGEQVGALELSFTNPDDELADLRAENAELRALNEQLAGECVALRTRERCCG